MPNMHFAVWQILSGYDRQLSDYQNGGGIMAGLEGQKAPAFTLPGSDGKKHSLADYTGKNVILWFYPKDDTPG